jgi:uncharacterized protein
MKCPVCPDTTLAMSNRQGIEIDYCPQCRGVWLDRGELDKLIERSSTEPAPSPVRNAEYAPAPRYDDDDRRHPSHGDYHKRKKRGLLGELFDFD